MQLSQVSRGDLPVITICRILHIASNQPEGELETIQDIRSSACLKLIALPSLRYHNLIVVDNLRLKVCVDVHV